MSSVATARELEIYENDARASRPGGFHAKLTTPGDDDICDFRSAKPSERACAGVDVTGAQASMTASVRGSPGFEWLAQAAVLLDGSHISVAVIRMDFDTRGGVSEADVSANIAVLKESLSQGAGSPARIVGGPNIVMSPSPAGTFDAEIGTGETAQFARVHLVFGGGSAYELLFVGPRNQQKAVEELAQGTIATIRLQAPVDRTERKASRLLLLLLLAPITLIGWLRRKSRGETRSQEVARTWSGVEPPTESVETRDERRARRAMRKARRAERDAADDAGA